MTQEYAQGRGQTCLSSCPFYACHTSASEDLRVMIQHREKSNQCGLIVPDLAPCRMELAGTAPNWQNCPLRNRYGERRIFERLRDLRVFPNDSEVAVSFDDWIARFGLSSK